MEKVKDYYGILDIDSTATTSEIQKAYRKLAKKYHPDVSKEENAVEMFKKVKEAYKVLTEERDTYDAYVKRNSEGKDISFQEVVDLFHSSVDGAFTDIKGENVEIDVEFYVSEIRQEARKVVTFDRYVNCSDCKGHGFPRDGSYVCHDCQGKGYSLIEAHTPFGDIKTEKLCRSCSGKGHLNTEICPSCEGNGKKNLLVKFTFGLPKDANKGKKLTFKEKGDAGLNGGAHGDLFVNLKQAIDDPYTIVNRYDLETKVDVPFLTSLTGGKISVQLPRGVTVKIPIAKGTQSGHRIIVPDEGLFNSRNGFYGTLTLEVNLLAPVGLSNEKVKKLIGILK